MDNEEANEPEEIFEEGAGGIASDVRVETDSVSTAICEKCGCEIDVEGIASFDAVECPDCNERVTVPAKLGPFLLVEMLGAGGMGAVYIAKDELLGRKVAIKVMLKSLGEDKEFIEAFKREAQAAAKINHPNICQIYSFGQEKGQPYIVMELISGERFDALVESGKKLDQGLVMQVAHDIAQGLAAAYEENMLHGDIKPENILLDEKLTAKLVDFGIASVAGQSSEGIWGTPYYIAPEKILRQKPDGRSDMYSLGATLYHALAGKPPFDGATPIEVVKKRLDKNPKSIASIRPDLKPEVVAVIERMLQRNPTMRHPTYSSLVSDLGRCVQICGGRKKSLAKLKKTGRLMITKRTKVVAAAPDTASPTQKSMPKIRVPKRNIVMPSKATIKGKKVSVSSSSSSSRPSPTATPAPRKPPSKAPLVIFLILLLLAVFGGVGYYLYDKRQKEYQARREFLAYTKTVEGMGKELAAVSNSYSSVIKLIDSVADYPKIASNAVKTVLGEDLSSPAKKPAATPSASPATKPASTPAPKAEPAKRTVDERGREAPAGLEEEGPPPPPPPAKTGPAPEPEPAEKIEVPPPASGDPKIKQLARSLLEDCSRLEDKRADADEKKEAAITAFEEGRDSRNHLVAAEKLKAIKEIGESLSALKETCQTIANKAKERADEVEQMRVAFVEEEKRKQDAIEAAEKARRDAEEAARKASEHAELVKTEQGLVSTAAAQARDMLRANDFSGALSLLEAEAKALTTDEGKQAIAMPIAQSKLLVEMKEFIAKQLTEDRYAWGWIVDGRAVDVVSATTEKITTRTREADWAEVTVAQMLHFFKKYMTKKSIPLKTLGRMNMAAAVYCSLHEGGAEASASYSDMAEIHDPNIFKLREEVLPPRESLF